MCMFVEPLWFRVVENIYLYNIYCIDFIELCASLVSRIIIYWCERSDWHLGWEWFGGLHILYAHTSEGKWLSLSELQRSRNPKRYCKWYKQWDRLRMMPQASHWTFHQIMIVTRHYRQRASLRVQTLHKYLLTEPAMPSFPAPRVPTKGSNDGLMPPLTTAFRFSYRAS